MRSWLLLAAVVAGCNPPPPPEAPVPGVIAAPGEQVGTVNGIPIGAAELGLVYERMRVPKDKIPGLENSPQGRHVAEEYAVATLLYDKAVKEKLHQDPKVQLQLAFVERQVLAQAMREKLATAAVTDAAVQGWYEENKARFDKPEVKARQIVVATEAQAKDLAARLEKGEDFGELAKAHSIDTVTGPLGGELGWFKAHELAQIGDQVMAAEPGARLGPLETRLGWHLVEVQAKRPATPLEEVRPEAEAHLFKAEATKQMEALREAAKIEWAKPIDTEYEKRNNLPPAGAGGMPAGHPPTEGQHP